MDDDEFRNRLQTQTVIIMNTTTSRASSGKLPELARDVVALVAVKINGEL